MNLKKRLNNGDTINAVINNRMEVAYPLKYKTENAIIAMNTAISIWRISMNAFIANLVY